MADNVELNAGTGGITLATDDIGGVHYQIVKLTFGALDSQTIVSAANPLPVVQTGTLNVGTVTAVTAISNALPAGTNNIGDVDVLSIAAGDNNIGNVDIASIAAGDNNIGNVDVVSLPALAAGTNNIGDVDVLSVVPGTGATNLGKAIDTATGGTDTGVLVLATRDDALSALTPIEGDNVQLRTDSTGALWVATSNGISGIADDAAFTPATSEVLPVGFTFDDTAPDSVDEGDIGAGRMSANRCQYVNIRDNAGNERGLNIDASGQLAITLAAAQTLATVTTVGTVTNITNQGQIVDDAAFTAATTRVTMAGYFADETATDSVDEGDGGAARMTLDRKVIVTPYPHTAGGLTIFRSIDLDETEEEIKATAGQVYGMWVTNTATSTRFVKFYNATAANVSVGTTTPVITIGIPGNATDDVSGNFGPGGMGIAFGTAITVAATTGVADADTGAPGANEVIVNVFYS